MTALFRKMTDIYSLRNKRGFMLMTFSWFIAVFALITQVFMVQGLVGLRSISWQQEEAQAKRFAEAGLDAIVNFYEQTQVEDCYDWQKTLFSSNPWTGTDADCGNPLQLEIANAKLNVRAALGLVNNDNNVMIVYRVTPGAGNDRNISVKGYRDWGTNTYVPNNPRPRAIAQVNATISLFREFSDGFVGINRIEVQSFGQINGDLKTLSGAPDSIHLAKNVWVKGQISVGTVTVGNPNVYSDWVGSNMASHAIYFADGAALMDSDPASMNYASRSSSIVSPPENGIVLPIDPFKNTIADQNYLHNATIKPTVLSAELEASKIFLSQPTATILSQAAINCSQTPLNIADFYPLTISTPQSGNPAGVYCYPYIDMGKNATLRYNIGGPVTIYLSGSIGTDPTLAMRVGDTSAVYAWDGSLSKINDGVLIKMANSMPGTNGITFISNASLSGSIHAPKSIVNFGSFATVDGKAVMADQLILNKMAQANMPHSTQASSAFRVTAIKNWVQRPDPELEPEI